MPHSTLLPFNFVYDDRFGVPLIPITFMHRDGTQTRLLNNAILDSGAFKITIPKALAEILGLQLHPKGSPTLTAAGASQAYSTIVNFNLGRGGRVVKYTDTEICVMEHCPAVLVGIQPIFQDYTVTVKAYQNTCILEPKE